MSVLLAAVLLISSCSSSKDDTEASTEAVKQDFAESNAEVLIVTIAMAIVEALYGFGGTYGDDDIDDCGEGEFSLNPIAVVNTYTSPQDMSITINPDLAKNVNFLPAADGPVTSGCQINSELNGTFDVTVPAGEPGAASFTVIGWLAAGSAGTEDNSGSLNVAIGAGGEQWYDFWLHDDFWDTGFENFELNYSNTGGLDPSQNLQTGLFNGLDCTANSAGNISLTSPNTVTTPFTSDNANAWTFGQNQPICFGFLQPDSAAQS